MNDRAVVEEWHGILGHGKSSPCSPFSDHSFSLAEMQIWLWTILSHPKELPTTDNQKGRCGCWDHRAIVIAGGEGTEQMSLFFKTRSYPVCTMAVKLLCSWVEPIVWILMDAGELLFPRRWAWLLTTLWLRLPFWVPLASCEQVPQVLCSNFSFILFVGDIWRWGFVYVCVWGGN